MMCDFNTTNLQGLFSSASQPAPQFQQIPFQNLSPSSNATSPPYSISSIAPASSSPSDYNYLINATQPLSYPSQYLAPNSAASTYPTPSRHPSFSSGASPNYGQPLFVAEEDSSNSKRRRLTLAETAGLAPHSHPSLSSNSTTFTVKPDAFGHKSMSQPLLAPAPPPTKTQRQKSPVELIANAGIGRAGVYNPREFCSLRHLALLILIELARSSYLSSPTETCQRRSRSEYEWKRKEDCSLSNSNIGSYRRQEWQAKENG